MQVKQVKSWSQFIKAIEELQAVRDKYASNTPTSVSELLYRGQSDSRWKLETTLERLIPGRISLQNYYNFVWVIKAKIESVTGMRWRIPSREKYAKWCKEQQLQPLKPFLGYDYLSYLRHHGFPSPLMDWTRSPYIAAHFAMVEPPADGRDSVAVYAFLEYARGIKIDDISGPFIQSLGPYVTTHRRHYLQQSTYTICTTGIGSPLSYGSHEDVVARHQEGQDLPWKIVVPTTKRREFLSKLEMMNINSFSLFETDEKLMEHIYVSEVLLRHRLQGDNSTSK